MIEHIPELVEAGIDSLKIEGRMKRPEYVAVVTGIYRRLLDERRQPTAAEGAALERAFSAPIPEEVYDALEKEMEGET